LHSAARTGLRAAREEAEVEARLRKVADEQADSLKSELAEQRSLLEQEKASLESNLKEYEMNLEETRAQNTLLHGQLEQIGDQIEKIQTGKAAEATEGTPSEGSPDEVFNLQKTVSELREVVRFLRLEKDMIQAQLDTARRSAERERAVAAVAKRSLDEARVELKVMEESSKGVDAGDGADMDALKEKLRAAEGQSRLLGDSNAHLREEFEKLKNNTSSLEEELDTTKKAAQPSEKRQQELETEKAGLIAEKESLLREIDDWKGRVQSLVSKFNQVRVCC
jgi:nucleoprotein TPR